MRHPNKLHIIYYNHFISFHFMCCAAHSCVFCRFWRPSKFEAKPGRQKKLPFSAQRVKPPPPQLCQKICQRKILWQIGKVGCFVESFLIKIWNLQKRGISVWLYRRTWIIYWMHTACNGLMDWKWAQRRMKETTIYYSSRFLNIY